MNISANNAARNLNLSGRTARQTPLLLARIALAQKPDANFPALMLLAGVKA